MPKNKKVTPEAKPTTPVSLVAKSIFDLKEIRMKDDKAWRLKAVLKVSLPQSFREYDVKLSLNEEPYESRIKDVERKIEEVNLSNELFDKRDAIAEMRGQIKDIQEELAEALKETHTIEFSGVLEELKYKDSDTVVVMLIPADVIQELNDARFKFETYKIELLREEKKDKE